MKQQIARFSPHQNGKIFAILMAIGSLVFVVPFTPLAFASAPPDARPPLLFMLGMPVLYLVMGYISVVIGCALYNLLFKHIGGIEFEARPVDA